MKQNPREREREVLVCLSDDRFRQCDNCVCQSKVSWVQNTESEWEQSRENSQKVSHLTSDALGFVLYECLLLLVFLSFFALYVIFFIYIFKLIMKQP